MGCFEKERCNRSTNDLGEEVMTEGRAHIGFAGEMWEVGVAIRGSQDTQMQGG